MTTETPASAATAAAPHPLIARLMTQHGYPELTPETFDAFAGRPGRALLFFTEDPVRYRETVDLAVIVPEIARAFAGGLRVGVLLPPAARAIAVRFGFRRWPALVMLDGGGYVGAIDGLRNWDEYINEVARLLAAPVTRPPSIGIAVKGPADAGACGA